MRRIIDFFKELKKKVIPECFYWGSRILDARLKRSGMTMIFMLFLCSPNAFADSTAGLVGWWKFNEDSGNALDSSGQGNVGTPSGTTIVGACARSGCRDFNGTTDHVSLGSPSSLNTFTAITVSAWIRPTATAANYIIVRKNNATGGANHDLYQLDINANGVRFLAAANGSGVQVSGGNTVIGANNWYHVTGVYDGTTVRCYLNGVQESTTDALNGTIDTSSGYGARIGRVEAESGGNAPFAGRIDDVRIFNRALTAFEVQQLYQFGEQGLFRGGILNGFVSKP